MSESNKKIKADQIVIVTNEPSSPSGLVWDGANYSCAYDALFTVLYDIWSNGKMFGQEDSRKLISTSQVIVCLFSTKYEWSDHL